MTEDEVHDLVSEYPPNVRKAIKAALYAADSKRDPKKDAKVLADLGALIAAGGKPGPATIIAAVAAGVSILRWQSDKRKRRIARQRAAYTAAGLAAKRASELASARANARRGK